MKILHVVGARPNMMKIAPLIEQVEKYEDMEQMLLHTGQHYDTNMSQIFFEELAIPQPDVYLGIGSGSHAQQTAQVMIAFEKVLLDWQPDVVVVVGDVNSTLACSLVATKLHVPVAHVEAGLRSFDRTMPEEINRIVTDAVSDLLFTTSCDANENLRREGVNPAKFFFVGNIMIDTLHKHRQRAERLQTPAKFGLGAHHYALLTLHRPANVDNPVVLRGILEALMAIQHEIPIVFPLHPRTKHQLAKYELQSWLETAPNLRLIPPQGYLAFLDLMMHAKLVLTDSGGIQEETTILDIPCLTLRDSTERPVTVTQGTNELIGTNPAAIVVAVRKVLCGDNKQGRTPELWDGHTAQRIVDILRQQIT